MWCESLDYRIVFCYVICMLKQIEKVFKFYFLIFIKFSRPMESFISINFSFAKWSINVGIK